MAVFSSTTLTDTGPGCVACTVEMSFLWFGAWKAQVRLSASPGSFEGPLSGMQVVAFSLCLQWKGTGMGVDRERRERGKNRREKDRKREGGVWENRESYQIRASLVTSFDPRDPVSRLSRGGQGFSKLTLEGTPCGACQYHVGNQSEEGQLW